MLSQLFKMFLKNLVPCKLFETFGSNTLVFYGHLSLLYNFSLFMCLFMLTTDNHRNYETLEVDALFK